MVAKARFAEGEKRDYEQTTTGVSFFSLGVLCIVLLHEHQVQAREEQPKSTQNNMAELMSIKQRYLCDAPR